MTAPNDGASAQNILDKLDGVNAGNSEPFRRVAMLYDANILGLETDYAFPEGGNVSSSALDQVTTLTKVLTRKVKMADGNSYDALDMLATLCKALIMANPYINDDEVNSVNHRRAAPK